MESSASTADTVYEYKPIFQQREHKGEPIETVAKMMSMMTYKDSPDDIYTVENIQAKRENIIKRMDAMTPPDMKK